MRLLRLLPEEAEEARPEAVRDVPEAARELPEAEREDPATEEPERVDPLREEELLRATRDSEAEEAAELLRPPARVEAVERVAPVPLRWEPAKEVPGLRRLPEAKSLREPQLQPRPLLK